MIIEDFFIDGNEKLNMNHLWNCHNNLKVFFID